MASVSHNSASSLNLQFEQLEEKFQKHLNLKNVIRQILPIKKEVLDGKQMRVDFQYAGNSHGGARASGAYTPGYNPDSTYEDGMADFAVRQMLFKSKDYYMSTDFTGQMKAAIKSKKGGYKNLMDFRFEDTVDHLNENVAKLMGTTRLGTVGKVQTASSTTITLRYAGHNTFEAGNRYIRPGNRLDCADGSRTGALLTGSNDRGTKVTAVATDLGSDATGPTITVNRAPTNWGAGDFLTIFNERAEAAITTTGYDDNLYRPMGLLDAVDDGDYSAYYGGLNRAASGNESLKATVLDNGGTLRALTQRIVNHAIGQCNQLSGGKPKIFYSTFDVQRKFVDYLTTTGSSTTATDNPMRFNNPGATKVSIGFNSYDVFPLGLEGKLMFAPDRLAPHHCGILIDPNELVLVEDGPPEFIKYDGNTIRKVVGKDEATSDWVYRSVGVIARAPWKCIRIDDLEGDHTAM